jgi:hypothetical protein
MLARSAALIAACLFVGLGAADNSFAQTTPSLDDCRSQAIGRGLAGEARNKAINDCMGRPVVQGVSTAAGTRFSTCRSDARSRSLAGDAYSAALDECMSRSGAPAEAAGRATYQDCRTRAIGRGLAGEARAEFVDSCLTE